MFKVASRSSQRLQPHLTRGYAVVSSPVDYSRKGDQPAFAPTALKSVSRTAGGVSIATLDGRGPVSSLALVVAAGSRNESFDAPGTAHFLKTSIFRSVAGDNSARVVRELELRGNSMESAVTREHLIVSSTFLRDDLVDVVPLLVNHVFNPSFQPYEFLDAQPYVLSESAAALADPTTEVLDKLHQVAFRTGLGNSLFASPSSVNSLKRANLQEFAANYFTADRIALVGTGVAQDELAELLESSLKSVSLSSTKPTVAASQYFGGEARIEAGVKSTATYAIAFKSVSFSSPQYAASLVLRAALDGSRRLKWGAAGSSGLLSQASSADASVSAFNTSYTDAGLFGIIVQGSNSAVKGAAQKGIDALKAVASSVSASTLEKAKKAAVLDSEAALFGSRDAATHEIGKNVLASGNYSTVTELAAAISKVSPEEVSSLAKSLLSSKPSIAARGNLLKLPYSDELKF
ncbi:hypothetical protein HDU67_005098 [Dinochytrium kinnereticum]|nr:hypothetical protein HDU67_005098 [Dinochytrium kinnereticum]